MLVIIYFFVFLFGLIIGSFLNCLIWRLHTGESILGRSYCPKCKAKIAWYDNIPLLSFVLLRGRCRACRRRISLQYPAVELAAGLLFALSFYAQYQFNVQCQGHDIILLARNWFIIAVMIVIFVYDLRWYLILDVITLPAAAVVFGLNLLLGFSWQNLLFSGIIGAGFFLAQFVLSRGRWIGGGDIRLGLLMGLALGWPKIIWAIVLAYFLGSIISLGLLLSGKKQWSSRIPLGTFLAPATLIILFWGEKIIAWYLNKILFFTF